MVMMLHSAGNYCYKGFLRSSYSCLRSIGWRHKKRTYFLFSVSFNDSTFIWDEKGFYRGRRRQWLMRRVHEQTRFNQRGLRRYKYRFWLYRIGLNSFNFCLSKGENLQTFWCVCWCRDVSDSAFTYSLLFGGKEKKQLRLFRHSSVQWYHLNKPIICFIFLKSLPWLYLAGFSLKNTRTHSTEPTLDETRTTRTACLLAQQWLLCCHNAASDYTKSSKDTWSDIECIPSQCSCLWQKFRLLLLKLKGKKIYHLSHSLRIPTEVST